MYQIALLTDFGQKDWYVPVMKSVILSINDKVRLIDVTHEVSPQNSNEAAFVLWNAYQQFAAPTIFVVVVDPGVGSERAIIAVKTDKHIIIAPDNVSLDLILSTEKIEQAVQVKNLKFFLDEVSETFHGRDIFAPVAANLSKGIALAEFGAAVNYPPIQSPLINADKKGQYEGFVIYIDRFGNLITNIKIPPAIDCEIVLNKEINIPKISKTYADVPIGNVVAYRGSSGLLEIAIRNGNAKKGLKMDYQTPVRLILK